MERATVRYWPPRPILGGRDVDCSSVTGLGPFTSEFKFWHYAKRRFSVTLNLWYMYEVLNVDEIKN